MSFQGRKHSEETLAKMREAQKRRRADEPTAMSEDGRQRISEQTKARWQNPELREKYEANARAAAEDPESRAKISKANTGRVRSQEHKDAVGKKAREMWADPVKRAEMLETRARNKKPRSPEFCEAISERNRARAGQVHWSEEAKARVSEAMKARGKRHSPETKEKMSQARLQHLQTAGFVFMGHQQTRWGLMPYRSTWELATIRHLDANPNVVRVWYETVVIPYTFDEVQKNYVPDFLVENARGEFYLVEVKPRKFLQSDPQTMAKIAAARAYCEAQRWSLVLVSEIELKSEFPLF